jgi:hypothetical protein
VRRWMFTLLRGYCDKTKPSRVGNNRAKDQKTDIIRPSYAYHSGRSGAGASLGCPLHPRADFLPCLLRSEYAEGRSSRRYAESKYDLTKEWPDPRPRTPQRNPSHTYGKLQGAWFASRTRSKYRSLLP